MFFFRGHAVSGPRKKRQFGRDKKKGRDELAYIAWFRSGYTVFRVFTVLLDL